MLKNILKNVCYFIQTGREIFNCLGDRVSVFLSYADEGSGFVYGYLVTGKPFK
jgi:nucleoside permease NupC